MQSNGALTPCWWACEIARPSGKLEVSLKVKRTPVCEPVILILDTYPRSSSAQTSSVKKCPRLGGLDNRHLFSHSCGGWKSETQVSAWVVAGEVSLLGMKTLTSCRVLVWPFLCTAQRKLWCHFLFSKGHQSYWIRTCPLWPHLTLIISVKALDSHIRGWGVNMWRGGTK